MNENYVEMDQENQETVITEEKSNNVVVEAFKRNWKRLAIGAVVGCGIGLAAGVIVRKLLSGNGEVIETIAEVSDVVK